MAFTIKYQGEWKDNENGDLFRVDILEDGTFTIQELEIMNITLEYSGGNLKTEPLVTSRAIITFMATSNYQFEDLKFATSRQFQVSIVHNDTTRIWNGWMLPLAFKEPFRDSKFPITLAATDFLPQLKRILYDDEGIVNQAFTPEDLFSTLDIFQEILFELIPGGSANQGNFSGTLYENMNFLEDSIGTTATDSNISDEIALAKQVLVERGIFYDYADYLDAHQILTNILTSWGCRLFVAGDYQSNTDSLAYIVQNIINSNTSYTRRNINLNTSGITDDGTFDPIIEIPREYSTLDGATYSLDLAYRDVVTSIDRGRIESLLIGDNFSVDDFTTGDPDHWGALSLWAFDAGWIEPAVTEVTLDGRDRALDIEKAYDGDATKNHMTQGSIGNFQAALPSDNTADISLSSHGYSAGDYIPVFGTDDSGYNGLYKVESSIDVDNLRIHMSNLPDPGDENIVTIRRPGTASNVHGAIESVDAEPFKIGEADVALLQSSTQFLRIEVKWELTVDDSLGDEFIFGGTDSDEEKFETFIGIIAYKSATDYLTVDQAGGWRARNSKDTEIGVLRIQADEPGNLGTFSKNIDLSSANGYSYTSGTPRLRVVIFQTLNRAASANSAVGDKLRIHSIKLQLSPKGMDDDVVATANASNVQDLKFNHPHPDATGDNSEFLHDTGFYSHVGGAISHADSWTDRAGAGGKSLQQRMADDLADLYDKPSVVFQASILGAFITPQMIIRDLNNFERTFIPTQITMDMKEMISNVTAVEINPQGEISKLSASLSTGITDNLKNVFVIDEDVDADVFEVWICGKDDAVLESNDSGASFTDRATGEGAATDWLAMHGYQDAANRVIWVAGTGGKLYRWGGSWSNQTANVNTTEDILGFHAISTTGGASNQRAFLCGLSGVIERSTDLGSIWTTETTPVSSSLQAIFNWFLTVGKRDAVCCGVSGVIMTRVGGIWTEATTPDSTTSVRDIKMHVGDNFKLKSNIGWAVGHATTGGGKIWFSSDQGSTWSEEYTNATLNYFITGLVIDKKDPLRIWIVGDNGSLGFMGTFKKGDSAPTVFTTDTDNMTGKIDYNFNSPHKAYATGDNGELRRLFLYS